MAIHWQVKFRALRTDTLYTASIYDGNYSGQPIQLIGAEQPFETQEDDVDDMFVPVRKQSGYLRIVDTGYAANGSTPFNWRQFIPTTDTDRPVILTNANGDVMWQGFLQAQNFGASLYEKPQERNFPLQCSLSVTSRLDISISNKNIRNFAYLLLQVVYAIPETCRPNRFLFQGGSAALEWLLVRVDYQNFININKDQTTEPKYNAYQLLEEICRFWGWTARTEGQSLYFVCIDDSNQQFVSLTNIELNEMAAGHTAFDAYANLSLVNYGADIYASVSNDDYQLRGPNKATVSVDINEADEDIVDAFDSKMKEEMLATGWSSGYNQNHMFYTQDKLTLNREWLTVNCQSTMASMNVAFNDAFFEEEVGCVFRIKKTYTGASFVVMETLYEHSFTDGFFRMQGTVYRDGEVYRSGESFAGDPDMWMRLGIGQSWSNAIWWDGKEWQSNPVEFRATIGNRDKEIFTRYWTGDVFDTAVESNIIETTSGMSGRLFIALLGSNSRAFEDVDEQKAFDIEGFKILFTKNNTVTMHAYPNSGWHKIMKKNLDTDYEYRARSNNNIAEDYDVDCIFASEGVMPFGYGVLLNSDNTYFKGYPYSGGSTLIRPEQHLADRIVNYWQTSKRKIVCDLRTDAVARQTPLVYGTIDGTSMYPVSISHVWRDEITRVVFMQFNHT